MSYLTDNKKNILIHLLFLFILSLYYLIPYFLVGQLIVLPIDLLDIGIVENHIIGRIYNGDSESVNLFLSGEIKWYFLKRILQPLLLLYAFFETEVAYWITDILIKLICYICFFKLSRKLNCLPFNSALIACLIVSGIGHYYTALGLGLVTFPYLTYLIIKNKNLNLKHYCFITFIGLNFDLVDHTFVIPMLFFVSVILFPKSQRYNFILFLKISLVLFFFAVISNSNLIYAQLFSEPSHRTAFFITTPDLITNFFNNLIKPFFSIPDIKGNSYFFHYILLELYSFFIILISLFSKNKKAYLLLLVNFLVLFIIFIMNLEFVISIRNSSDGLLKIINWQKIIIPLTDPFPALYGLLLVININFIIKKTRYLVYPLTFLVIIFSQITISIVPLSKHFVSFNTLSAEQKNQLRKSFHDQKYRSLINDIIKFNKSRTSYSKKNFESKYTFKGYYDYQNYKYIKSIVGDSRTISIALDPMVAVMNNIKVIDGYHALYPLSYKLKFRKVIEEQLKHSRKIEEYYDLWGNRIYTFVENEKLIKTNFIQAKTLGAEYVISKYLISNKNLISICEKCNNSPELFLYKINN